MKRGHDCSLISTDDELKDTHVQYDFIMFVSATFYFQFERFVELMDNQTNCKIGWITNEHDLFMQDFLKKYGVDFIIANFEESGVKKAHRSYEKFLMVNLNTLIAKPRNPWYLKKHDLIYYGTYRKWRDDYFKKYLVDDMILSTSSKNVKKYLISGCDCLLTDRLNWKHGQETLNLFKASLYIEDNVNHKLYNHLANRWYESLSCNCMMFFDKSCENTIKRSGYQINDYFMVDSYEEIVDKIDNVDVDMLDHHFIINTDLALTEKSRTLSDIEQFLLNYDQVIPHEPSNALLTS
jgi:hypothetical protein